jgi:hypothetical protein
MLPKANVDNCQPELWQELGSFRTVQLIAACPIVSIPYVCFRSVQLIAACPFVLSVCSQLANLMLLAGKLPFAIDILIDMILSQAIPLDNNNAIVCKA